MQTPYDAETPAVSASVALGLFDGVHRGHQAVLQAAAARAPEGLEPVAFTFQTLTMPVKQGRPVEALCTEQQKRRLLLHSGMKAVYSPAFPELRHLSGEAFCREILCRQLHAKAVFCGRDFRFGAQAAWDFSALCAFGEQMGFAVYAVEPVRQDGAVISSTAIRQQLHRGEPEQAAVLLGRPYSLEGTVCHGKALGRTIQFPTINLPFAPGMLVPRYGVYFTRVTTPQGVYRGVTNIGVKPTVTNARMPVAETNLLDFSGDLYGTVCSAELLHFSRPEQKFEDITALKAAIAADCEAARNWFAAQGCEK